jgi:hypothetical protein
MLTIWHSISPCSLAAAFGVSPAGSVSVGLLAVLVAGAVGGAAGEVGAGASVTAYGSPGAVALAGAADGLACPHAESSTAAATIRLRIIFRITFESILKFMT